MPWPTEPGAGIAVHSSPNHGPRRGGARPDLIVLHHTAMTSAGAALARLCDPSAEVSAHYLICERGRIWRLVPEEARAWHAGAGRWGDVDDVNSRSIGIELANRGDHPYSMPQMAALEGLLLDLMVRWHIPPERVIGHSDMAPLRKSDPGPRFDWCRLARQGLSVWPRPGPPIAPDGASFEAALRRFGYPSAPPSVLLRAFRLRFFPQGCGPLSATEMAAAADLATRFPAVPDETGRGVSRRGSGHPSRP